VARVRTLGVALIAVTGAIAVAAGPTATGSGTPIPEPQPCAGPSCWDPEPTTEPWQWQLQGRIDLSVPAPVYDIDIDNPPSVVEAIHAQGDRAICYFSVGTFEPFRRDADRFPRRVLGRRLARFEDERWLDIRKQDVLRPIMEDRFDLVRRRGSTRSSRMWWTATRTRRGSHSSRATSSRTTRG